MARIDFTKRYELMYRISKPRWDNGSVPSQVIQLASHPGKTRNAIDLGCGTGTHSIYLAQQGFSVIGVDISPTAIERGPEESIRSRRKTRIYHPRCDAPGFLNGPFDIALDVGCFHGMNSGSQQRYALELIRLMQPEGTLLIWGMDPRPLGLVSLIPDEVEKAFTPGFKLERVDLSQANQRQGKWYWLTRQ